MPTASRTCISGRIFSTPYMSDEQAIAFTRTTGDGTACDSRRTTSNVMNAMSSSDTSVTEAAPHAPKRGMSAR